MMYKNNFKIKNLTLPNNIFYAPLAGCSDLPFRRIALNFKPGLMFCEMVKIEALVRNHSKTMEMLDFDDNMHPIGAQICGSNAKTAREAAKIVEGLGFDLIDLNCGCPVDKVTKDGSGSGLLKTPELIAEIINAIVDAVSIPVTVKIRSGWDDNEIVAPLITQLVEKAGASAITIHGRTRKQVYKGKANWDVIKECKAIAKDIKVIGNGDVFEPEDAFAMFNHTGCDGVLLGRGILGRPSLAMEIDDFYNNKDSWRFSPFDLKELMLKHFNYIIEYKEEPKSIFDMRRVGHWYLKRCPGSKKLKVALNEAKSFDEIKKNIESFDWEECQKYFK